MASYTQSNTDPVSVNGMFLKFYLDTMFGMTETFKEQNAGGFNLYAMFLRSCIPRKDLRDEIDMEIIEVNRKINDGIYGETSKQQAEFIRGFCIVSASTKFLNDAFHIMLNDSSALADTTDDDLLIQLEKYSMYKKVRLAFSKDKTKLKKFERNIADGSILNMADLMKEISAPDIEIPQDDHITQTDTIGASDDSSY